MTENKFPEYAFPGGYPIFYLCESAGPGYHAVLCGDCAQTETACPINDVSTVLPFIIEEGETCCDACGRIEGESDNG